MFHLQTHAVSSTSSRHGHMSTEQINILRILDKMGHRLQSLVLEARRDIHAVGDVRRAQAHAIITLCHTLSSRTVTRVPPFKRRVRSLLMTPFRFLPILWED